MKFVVVVLSLFLVVVLATVIKNFDPLGSSNNDRWCNPNLPCFQQSNAVQLKNTGNWSQSISYLLPLNLSNPGDFTYTASSSYFQVNSYDQPNCRFLSVQGWPSCPGPLQQAVFPNGLYLQTVAQKIVIDRNDPSAPQRYEVDYITPAVPIVPAQNTNKWVSVAVGPSTLANSVYRVVDGEVTEEVVYTETITVTRTGTPDAPGHRFYLTGTIGGTALTAIAPFDSAGMKELPTPYDTLIQQYIDGHVQLSYLRSCDSGATWTLSNCRQCGSSAARSPCVPCVSPEQELCVSTYYLPFPASADPCA